MLGERPYTVHWKTNPAAGGSSRVPIQEVPNIDAHLASFSAIARNKEAQFRKEEEAYRNANNSKEHA